MAYELAKNFQVSTVATAPSPATSGTSLVVAAGEGARFDTPPFNAVVCPADAQPTSANAEVVRVTGISTDTFSTIVRAQESSTARSIVVGDRIFVGPTLNVFNAIAFDVAAKRLSVNTVTTYLPLSIWEANPTQTASPFSNSIPGTQLAATGFTIINCNTFFPAEAIGNAIKVRLALACATGGDMRIAADVLKLATGGTITGAQGGGTAQTVTLVSNQIKIVDIVNSGTATPGSWLNIHIFRDADNAADTLAQIVMLMGAALVCDITV